MGQNAKASRPSHKRTDNMIVQRRKNRIAERSLETHATSLKKGPFVDLHLAKKVQVASAKNDASRSRPGRAARWSFLTWSD